MPTATSGIPATVSYLMTGSASQAIRPMSTTMSPSVIFSAGQVVQLRPWCSMSIRGRWKGAGSTRRGTGWLGRVSPLNVERVAASAREMGRRSSACTGADAAAVCCSACAMESSDMNASTGRVPFSLPARALSTSRPSESGISMMWAGLSLTIRPSVFGQAIGSDNEAPGS